MNNQDNKEILLLNFINNLDPYDMIKYGDKLIYQKKVKMILKKKIITSGNILDIFYIGYKKYFSIDIAKQIYLYIVSENFMKS